MSVDWFDELELSPTAHPVSMGTRSLGDRPWLVIDDRRAVELAEKRRSLVERRDDVAWFTTASHEAADALIALMAGYGVAVHPESVEAAGVHPLERAALAVQDDLVLLRRIEGIWHHDASVVCFPTHWHLPSKVGRPVAEVHAPVRDYDTRIADRVSRLFDDLADRGDDRPVWRRNFGLVDDTTLFQPDYRGGDPDVAAERVLTDLYIRSERQVLRRLGPAGSDWIAFTIRVQIEPLGALLADDADRVARFRTWVADTPPDLATRRHLQPTQRTALLAALVNTPWGRG